MVVEYIISLGGGKGICAQWFHIVEKISSPNVQVFVLCVICNSCKN